MTKFKSLALGTVAALLLSAQSALAVTYGFGQITANGNTAVATQLSVDVTGAGSGPVSFQFSNSGPNGSSITDIYFDDFLPGVLSGIASFINGAGVSFDDPATPANLPAGSSITPAFVTTAGLSADSDNPPPVNGINPGETLTIVMNLLSGKTFADVIAALNLGGSAGLRIGLHVQAIAGLGGSESFVNTGGGGGGGSPVPIPAAFPLLAAGLGALALVGRRRRKPVAPVA